MGSLQTPLLSTPSLSCILPFLSLFRIFSPVTTPLTSPLLIYLCSTPLPSLSRPWPSFNSPLLIHICSVPLPSLPSLILMTSPYIIYLCLIPVSFSVPSFFFLTSLLIYLLLHSPLIPPTSLLLLRSHFIIHYLSIFSHLSCSPILSHYSVATLFIFPPFLFSSHLILSILLSSSHWAPLSPSLSHLL